MPLVSTLYRVLFIEKVEQMCKHEPDIRVLHLLTITRRSKKPGRLETSSIPP